MSIIEINPNSYAAPKQRPAGMDPAVPYEPMLERRNSFFDWVTLTSIRTFYDIGAYRIPHAVLDYLRRDQLAPIQGTPGAPVTDVPTANRVAVIGDMGEGSSSEVRNAAQVLKWAPTTVATVGDNCYPLGRERDWKRRFDPQFEQLRMSTTWHPALGNHDYYNKDLTPYFQRFPALGGHAYYTWSQGPAQFFVLDSEQRLDGASSQQAWLAAELAKSTATYKVIQLHRPMVSSRAGSIGRNMHGSLGPLLAKYGVQLVLAGHEHGYERSRDSNGIVHMVTGGGGAASYAYPGRQPDFSIVRTPRYHHLQLAYDDTRMVIRAVDDRGQNFDTVTILPHATPVADAAAGAAAVTPPARAAEPLPAASV